MVRISGPRTFEMVARLAGGLPPARRMSLRYLRGADGLVLDHGLVVTFPGPDSFTGEDGAELHLHGSRAVVEAVLKVLTAWGANLAEPGEFTRRAFENGRLDLTEVEGLGDLIAAQTETQRRQAMLRAEGGLSDKLHAWRESLLALRAEIEAHLDFSDEEDVPFALPEAFSSKLQALAEELAAALQRFESGRLRREGFRVVLAGPPNAGKSSLLNALVQSDLAIVSNEAGTTRDVREVPMDYEGQLLLFYDVAGLRRTQSAAEAEGIRRARRTIEDADMVLWLQAPDVARDDSGAFKQAGLDVLSQEAERVLEVATKADLGIPVPGRLAVSVHDQHSINALLKVVGARAQTHIGAEPALLTHLRDKAAITAALGYLREAVASHLPLEMRAEALRLSSAQLEQLTGQMGVEDVLDRLFAGFCIGK